MISQLGEPIRFRWRRPALGCKTDSARLMPGRGARPRGASKTDAARPMPGRGARPRGASKTDSARPMPGRGARPRGASKTDSARPMPGRGARPRGAARQIQRGRCPAGASGQARSKTDSARPMPGWGRLGYERKTDSARRARIGPDHTGLVVCVGSCRLYPDARTRLPATPAHFIGCFFCAACREAQARPCMAFSGGCSHRTALRFPARKGEFCVPVVPAQCVRSI